MRRRCPRRESRRRCPRRETRHHQEQRPHNSQHKTNQWTKQQQVPAPSCRVVVSLSRDLPIPSLRARSRCSHTHFVGARTMEYTEGCPGCKGDGYYHNVQCKRRADHLGGAIQTASQAARRAADSSQVGSAIQNADESNVATSSLRCKLQST